MNMSYCRFRNTLLALEDCESAIDDNEELSEEEENAKNDLVEVCKNIADLCSN